MPDARTLRVLGKANHYELGAEDQTPFDVGMTIGGRPFGWFPECENREVLRWRLLPMDFQDTVETSVSVSFQQSGSMTGFYGVTGVRVEPEAMVAFGWRDDGSITSYVAVDYSHPSLAEFLPRLAGQFLDHQWPVCPDIEEHSWGIDLDIEGVISEGVIIATLAVLWRPCEEHRDDELLAADTAWNWVDGGWAPSSS